MDETFVKQLRQHFENKGITQKQIAEKLGVNPAYINKLLTGKKAFGKKTAKQFQDLFGLSSSWLLTGEGETLEKKIEDEPFPAATKTASSHKSIPLIPIDAMAGQLSGEDFQIMEYDCERYSIPDFDAADFLVTVSGDSMTPTFMSGDILAVRKVDTSRLWFQWGKPYVIATRQGCIVKRIMPSDKDGFVEIVSDNKEQYPKYDLHSEEIVGIALVIGLVRRL